MKSKINSEEVKKVVFELVSKSLDKFAFLHDANIEEGNSKEEIEQLSLMPLKLDMKFMMYWEKSDLPHAIKFKMFNNSCVDLHELKAWDYNKEGTYYTK